MSAAPRRVWLPWLLLLVPTLLIGAAALWLLWLEQQRIDQAALAVRQRVQVALQARAQVAADNIELLVSEIRDGLLRELAETPDRDLEALLANWPRTNPLVAETFLWRPDQAALAWPPADTPERCAFRQRHAALFGGGASSLAAAVRQEQLQTDRDAALPRSGPLAQASVEAPENREVVASQSVRLAVQQAARSSAFAAKNMVLPAEAAKKDTADEAYASRATEDSARAKTKFKAAERRYGSSEFKGRVPGAAMSSAAKAEVESPAPAADAEAQRRNGHPEPLLMDAAVVPWREPASGWLGRTGAGQVFFLGWWQPAGGGAVRGVELNLPAVLERAQALVPARTGEGGRFALHGPGEAQVEAPIRIPLSTTLPGWTLVALPGAAARLESLDVGGGFFVVAALLVGVFVVSIVAAGVLFFRQAAAAAREAALKTSFVSNVSHEMKTPLTTIRMYTEMLADERVGDPAKRSRYFATIGRETARLTRLVNNALDFGRLEAGRKEYRPEAIALGPWLARLVETYAPRAAESGVRLVATPPAAGAAVRCDPDSLDQMALNLVDNGLKYGAAGGVLELCTEAVAGGWAVVVADRGPGVPAAHRERIFERFHRVDDSLTATKQGAGLGLTIARRLARDQGGDLVCRERAGGGVAFVLTLPVAATA